VEIVKKGVLPFEITKRRKRGMKKAVRRLLCTAAAMALVMGVRPFLNGGATAETAYAKTNYASYYTVSGQEITIKSGYTDTDITEILNAALVQARDTARSQNQVTVRVPEGAYNLTANLRIYSNTTLDLTGVTLNYTGTESHVMLQSGINGSYMGESDYNNSSKCAGYNGFENITVKGGTFVSSSSNTGTIIRIAHATNVTLDGVTLKGGGCAHQAEVAAIDGFYVKNCSFLDWNGKKGSTEKFEALQLDIPCASKVFKNVYQDGTVMKNVEITGCTFANVPRGVGTHTLLVGAYHENIKINNNTFSNVKEEAVVCLAYKNSEVKNNTITDCGGGILFQYFKANISSVYSTTMDGAADVTSEVEHNANSVISGNNITIKYTGNCDEVQAIKVYGFNLEDAQKGADGKSVKAQNYYVSGVTVTKNTIVTAGYGIHLMDAVDCTITDNKITGKGFSSSDPFLKSTNYHGIYLGEGSVAKKISKNTISSAGTASSAMFGCGILVYNNSKVTGDISSNTISNTNAYGISISTNAKVGGSIKKNTISKVKKYSIFVNDASGTVTVKNNTIKGKGGSTSGIHVVKGKVSISGNTISNVGYGVHVASGVKGTIGKNTYGKGVTNQLYIAGKTSKQTKTVKL
jgi:parallel beta-helix repeat protein